MEEAPGRTPNPPRHKPSPRHTLEEVLRSLQDMVRNELAASGPPESAPDAPPEPARAGTAASAGDIEDDLRTVLYTLDGDAAPAAGRAPATGPLEASGTAEPLASRSIEFTLEPSPFPVPPAPAASGTPASATEPDAWAAAQPELPLLDLHGGPHEVAPTAEPYAAESTELEDVQFVDAGAIAEAVAAVTDASDTRAPLEPVREPAPESAPPALAAPLAEEPEPTGAPPTADAADGERERIEATAPPPDGDAQEAEWVEIPVLEEAVYLPPDDGPWGEAPDRESRSGATAQTIGTGTPAASPAEKIPQQLEVPLPSPEGARDVAIRTAARLNVELKRSGRRGLSNDVIVRLTQILRESLAQAGTNVDNTGSNDKP